MKLLVLLLVMMLMLSSVSCSRGKTRISLKEKDVVGLNFKVPPGYKTETKEKSTQDYLLEENKEEKQGKVLIW